MSIKVWTLSDPLVNKGVAQTARARKPLHISLGLRGFLLENLDSKSIQPQSHLKEQLTCVLPSHDPHQDVAKRKKTKNTTMVC